MTSPSLYERLGGEPAIVAAVDIFYEKVLADPLTAPFFGALDMKAQATKQVSFMTWAFGGPVEYRGRDLEASHAPLVARGLNDVHVTAVENHLEATLKELGVADLLIGEVMGAVKGLRDQVLGRASR